MNRVIKYRGWHNTLKKMFSPEEMAADQLTIMPDGSGFINVHSVSTKLSSRPDMVPLEYVNMLDKHGREIFDRDICRCLASTPNMEDIYVNGVMCWSDTFRQFTVWFRSNVEFASVKEVEIIGNVFEHPDLIPEFYKR